MINKPLLTHEVGSLAKPNWRVKAYAGRPLSDDDIADAQSWGDRLGVPDWPALIELLERAPLRRADRAVVQEWSSRYALRFFESAGLDVVYDGEQQRSEMYAAAVTRANGFEWRGHVRSFDNRYYRKAAVTGPLSLREPWHDDEFGFLHSVAKADLKVPITGAYTIAAWSFDERYEDAVDLSLPASERHARRHERRRELIVDVARNLVRPNLESLIALGAQWIQIDEPGASTEPDELDLFVESFNVSVEGLDAFFSTHLCFSDYNLFFPAIETMHGCRQFAVGFANDDTKELGTSDEARPGFQIIRRFADLPYEPILGLGVIDIHSDYLEPPELVRDRILYAVDVFGDPGRIHVTPDCGLRTRSWDVAYEKLRRMVAGVELAKRTLGV